MNYPELEDIFLRFGLYTEKTHATKASNCVMNGYPDNLVKTRRLSKSEANRIREQKEELEPAASDRVFIWL